MAKGIGEIAERFSDPVNGKVKRYSNGVYSGIECPNYDPCPICFRCIAKNRGKYNECRLCGVRTCIHSTKERNTLINK